MGFRFFRAIAVSGRDIVDSKGYNGGWLEDDTDNKVDSFPRRVWFGRRWILQEVALGRDISVRCSQLRMSWNWITHRVRILNNHELTKRSLKDCSMRPMETITYLDLRLNHILDMLCRCHISECSDPRDRTFALYGMAGGLTVPPV